MDVNRLKQTSSELIHAISKLASGEIGILQKITLNFEGLAIVEFTTEEGFTSPQAICETLTQSKGGAIGALDSLDSVTIQMVVKIDEEMANIGIDLTTPDVDRPTLLYVDAPKLGFSLGQHIALFRIYEALHTPRTKIPHPTENPGSDAVILLECLRQKASS